MASSVLMKLPRRSTGMFLRFFPHGHLLLHTHLHLHLDQDLDTLVPALAAMVMHEDEDEFAFSQVVDLMLEGLDHVIDVINLQRLHVVCLINLVMTSLAMNMIH